LEFLEIGHFMHKVLWCYSLVAALTLSSSHSSFAQEASEQSSGKKKSIIFIAGTPSHGYAAHEHYAGSKILAQTITERGFDVHTQVIPNGWPEDDSILNTADTIVVYSDGGEGHPLLPHLKRFGELMDKGIGFVCLHYALDVPKDRGGPEFRNWLGGAFETHWSVNPTWTADYKSLPQHPITSGIGPFSARDEWYFHMRFKDDGLKVIPILTAIPPESTVRRSDGPYEGNPTVRKEVANHVPQHMAWAYERENGGRSFGFTGGHFHWNWGRPEFNQLVSNAIVWTAGIDPTTAPRPSHSISASLLSEGQDDPKPANFNLQDVHKEFAIPISNSETAEKQLSNKGKAAPVYQSAIVSTSTPKHQVDINVPLTGAKKLYLVVTDAGDGIACDWADWINPTLVTNKGERIPLSDLQWTNTQIGWGQVHTNKNAGGSPLKVRDQVFENGIGAHSNSIIEYQLPENIDHFEAIGALDDGGTSQNGGRSTSVQFVIYANDAPANLQSVVPTSEQRKPENAVSGLDVYEGLEVRLAASEPQLKSLTNIDIDHRGRVWACEVVNYRQHRNDRAEGDRILILEDTDHDGVMDSSKVFYQGRDVDSALGICVLGNRLIVSCAPNVIEFVDTNGDDLPDQKNYIFTKTGDAQHDHSVHSFVVGPDNRLYFNFGNTGRQLCDKDGKPVLDQWGNPINDTGKPYRQGMAFRCNLDFTHMEVLGNNFRNNYELAVDSYGTVWQSDNDDDGNRGTRINYVMEYGNFGYTDEMNGDSWQKPRTNLEKEIPQRHWHLNDPGVVPTMLLTGAGSPTGIMVYEGNLLPAEFRNQVIHCDAGPNVVRAYPVKDDGAGYSASIVNLIEGTRDQWFRPADVCVAPDGSVFVSDWYDPGVGGHLMEDTERGRLFRIAPPDTKYNVATFDFSTPAGAVAALKNPNQSVRFLAMQALEKFGAQAENDLAKLFNSENSRESARAFWVLARIQSKGGQYIAQGLKHSDPNIRIAAVRAARATSQPRETFIDPLLQDSDPQVRRELCIALREDNSPEMPARWLALANQYDGKDRWMLEALGIAAMDRWDECIDLYLKSHNPSPSDLPVEQILWRSRAKKSASLIAGLLMDAGIAAGQIDPLMRAFDFQPTDQRQSALQELLHGSVSNNVLRDRIVTETVLRTANPGEAMADVKVADAVRRYVAALGNDASILPIVEKLAIDGLQERLIAIAMETSDFPTSIRAIDLALGKIGSAEFEKIILVSDDEADAQKKSLAQRLAKLISFSRQNVAAQIMHKALTEPGIDSSVRIAAATGLARSSAGQRTLIDLAEAKKLPADAATIVAPSLRDSKDAGIAKKANELFPPPASDTRPLAPISQLAELRGDAANGKKLFGSVATCAQCHIVQAAGKNVGPDLSEIGDKLTREAMYVAIINPSAGISHNYEAYSALTSSDEVITGLLVSKNDDEVIIKDKDGVERKIPMAEVEEFKKLETSLMPSNLTDLVDQQALVDIIEYMTTLKKRQ
jgi:putative membrane-bound dehydrogenase-like protein